MKRIQAALLLICMLASFAACGESGNPSETTDNLNTTVPEETADPNMPDFEYKDFGGVDFNVVSTESGWTTDWFNAEEETGDTLNDAVYKRDLAVEEALNVNLTYAQISVSNIDEPIRAAVMAGDCDYHIALTHQMGGVSAMVMENLLYDLSKLPYVDFDKPYWHKACNEAMAVNGHQYYAVSDYMKKDTYGMYFNKRLIDEFKLESPYDLVRSGDWTLDKMAQMASAAAVDLNGDTKMDYQDQYGFSSMSDFWLSMFIWSSDLRLCDPGTLELSLMSERTVSLFEKLYALLYESGDAYTWTFSTHFDNPEQRMLITSDRVLFTPNTIYSMVIYRDSDVDFGIVPMPKFDKEQKDYANINWNGLMCVPTAVSDPEMIGMAAELLSYYGGLYVKPAYYDTLLGAKLARDEDMREMIEFMFDHMVYDAGMHYFGQSGSMRNMYYSPAVVLFDRRSKDFASFYASSEPSCKQQIADFWKAVEENENK